MARTYKRDSRGRFAGGGGSSGGRSGGKAAAKSKPAKRSAPKTTSARGRALQNQRRAAALVSASRGGRGPSAKAVRSVLTAQRARAFYAATGGGKKRSVVKPAAKKSAKATAAAVRARTKAGSGVKAAEARARSSGRPKARVVAKPAAQRPAREPKTNSQILSQTRRIIEKASARKQAARLSYVAAKNERRIARATAVRQAILNPPKPKKSRKPRDPNHLTPTQLANRRWAASMDAWNRGMGR